VRAHAAARGLGPEAFEFQLLYGVRPALQRELAAAGHRVRVYVPFGPQWARYFRRRITERRANLMFALGSLFTK
jgi:proline dehydrogenase